MRKKRKRQVKRHRPVSYMRSTTIYGEQYIMVSRKGEAPEVKLLTGKKGRRQIK